MNWDDLRFFLAISRSRSISGAARRLNVQHSTVSRRLQQFEKTLGVRLFDKSRSGYKLTAAGEDLPGSATRMEREILNVDGTLLGRDTHLKGTLRVTTAEAMATTFLMPIFAGFSRSYPDVDLRIIVSNTYAILSEREADVAIRSTNSPPESLIGKQVGKIASTVFGSRIYLSKLRKTSGKPKWIHAEGHMPYKSWINKMATEQPRFFSVDNATLTHAALKEGLGIAILPCFMGDTDPLLQRYSDPVPETCSNLWILVHSDLKRSARVRVFREYVAAAINDDLDLLEGRYVQN